MFGISLGVRKGNFAGGTKKFLFQNDLKRYGYIKNYLFITLPSKQAFATKSEPYSQHVSVPNEF